MVLRNVQNQNIKKIFASRFINEIQRLVEISGLQPNEEGNILRILNIYITNKLIPNRSKRKAITTDSTSPLVKQIAKLADERSKEGRVNKAFYDIFSRPSIKTRVANLPKTDLSENTDGSTTIPSVSTRKP